MSSELRGKHTLGLKLLSILDFVFPIPQICMSLYVVTHLRHEPDWTAITKIYSGYFLVLVFAFYASIVAVWFSKPLAVRILLALTAVLVLPEIANIAAYIFNFWQAFETHSLPLWISLLGIVLQLAFLVLNYWYFIVVYRSKKILK